MTTPHDEPWWPPLRRRLLTPLWLAAAMLITSASAWLLPGLVDWPLGVHPRDLAGLVGVPLHPFAHADWAHLLSNLCGIIPLGWVVVLGDRGRFWPLILVGALASGAAIWVLGPSNTVHIGASGVVFALLGYLLGQGVFRRGVGTILLALGVFLLYGGALHGLLPGAEGVSWQGHAGGFLGGLLYAYALAPLHAASARAASAGAAPPTDQGDATAEANWRMDDRRAADSNSSSAEGAGYMDRFAARERALEERLARLEARADRSALHGGASDSSRSAPRDGEGRR